MAEITKDEFWSQYRMLKHLYNVTRNHFAGFIHYYKRYKKIIKLDSVQKAALLKLHRLWKSITNKTWYDDVGNYWVMKEYHAQLNEKLIISDKLYMDSIISLRIFRNRLGKLLKAVTPAQDIADADQNQLSPIATYYGPSAGLGSNVMVDPLAFRGVLKAAAIKLSRKDPSKKSKVHNQAKRRVTFAIGVNAGKDKEEEVADMENWDADNDGGDPKKNWGDVNPMAGCGDDDDDLKKNSGDYLNNMENWDDDFGDSEDDGRKLPVSEFKNKN